MRQAKVLVTDLLGLNNKIYHSGDVVCEDNFPEGNFDKLANQKFIGEPFEESGEEKPKDKLTKYTLKEVDLKNYPELAEQGLNAGDEVEIPEGYRVSKKGALVKEGK